MNLTISIKITILAFIAVMGVALIVGKYLHRGSSHILFKKAKERLRYEAQFQSEKLVSPIRILEQDIQFIKGIPLVSKLINPTVKNQNELINEMGLAMNHLLKSRPHYEKIEIISFHHQPTLILGLERFGSEVRINNNVVLNENQISWFTDRSNKFMPGNVYFSEIELHNKLENKVPIIKSIETIYSDEKPIGFILISLCMNKIFSDFINTLSYEFNPIIIDEKGVILFSDRNDFTLPLGQVGDSILNLYPQFKPFLSSNNKDQELTIPLNNNDKTLMQYHYHKTPLSKNQTERHLGLIIGLNENTLYAASDALQYKSLLGTLFLGIFCAIITSIFANRITTPISQITEGIEKYGLGEKNIDLPINKKDEIGTLARRFLDMMNQVERRTKDLALSENQNRVILETAHDGIITFDENNLIQSFNPAAQNLFEYSANEIIGKSIHILIEAKDQIHYSNTIKNFIESNKTQQNKGITKEFRGQKKDGLTVPLMFSMSMMAVESKKIIVCIVRDMSDKIEFEESLKKSESQLRLFVKHTPASIAMFDKNLNYIVVSDRWITDYNLENQNIIGKSHYSLFPQTSQKWKKIHEKVLKGEPEICQEDRYEMPDGTIEWIKWEVHPWFVSKNSIGGIIMFSEVITDRKEAEIKLKELHKQLLESSRQAGMAEVANSILHNIGNVLNSVNVSINFLKTHAHDLEVSKLCTAADIIQSHKSQLCNFFENNEQGKHFPDYFTYATKKMKGVEEKIISEITALKENIEHMGSIIHIQQRYSGSSLHEESLSLNDIIEDSIRLSGNSLNKWDIKIIKDLSIMPNFLLDKHKLIQIIVNLIRNAKDSLNECLIEDKEIKISTRDQKTSIIIQVSDNGLGMTQEIQNKLFNLGFTTKPDGHGYGLHNSALSAHEMGGKLTCFSEGNMKGATFILEIPKKEVKKVS